VQHGFGSSRNVTGFAVTMVVTYSETDSVKCNDASAYRNTIFCDWKPRRFRTTSLRRKSSKFRYKI